MTSAFDNKTGNEEITLSSGAATDDGLLFDVPDTAPKKINHKYIQQSGIKGITKTLVLYNDIYLHDSIKSFKNKGTLKRRIDLSHLDPRPERIVFIDWAWLYGAIGATAWSFVMMYLGVFTDFAIANVTMLPVGILLATLGMVGLMVFFYRSSDKLVFKSYIGRVPLLEIYNKPKQQEFNDFLTKLKSQINIAQNSKGLNMQQRLGGEVKELRRHVEEGTVKNNEYELARTRIFKHESFSQSPGSRN